MIHLLTVGLDDTRVNSGRLSAASLVAKSISSVSTSTSSGSLKATTSARLSLKDELTNKESELMQLFMQYETSKKAMIAGDWRSANSILTSHLIGELAGVQFTQSDWGMTLRKEDDVACEFDAIASLFDLFRMQLIVNCILLNVDNAAFLKLCDNAIASGSERLAQLQAADTDDDIEIAHEDDFKLSHYLYILCQIGLNDALMDGLKMRGKIYEANGMIDEALTDFRRVVFDRTNFECMAMLKNAKYVI